VLWQYTNTGTLYDENGADHLIQVDTSREANEAPTLLHCKSHKIKDTCADVVFTRKPHQRTYRIFALTTSRGYSQFINFATRGENVLDLIFSDDDQIICIMDCCPPLGNSDRCPLNFNL